MVPSCRCIELLHYISVYQMSSHIHEDPKRWQNSFPPFSPQYLSMVRYSINWKRLLSHQKLLSLTSQSRHSFLCLYSLSILTSITNAYSGSLSWNPLIHYHQVHHRRNWMPYSCHPVDKYHTVNLIYYYQTICSSSHLSTLLFCWIQIAFHPRPHKNAHGKFFSWLYKLLDTLST